MATRNRTIPHYLADRPLGFASREDRFAGGPLGNASREDRASRGKEVQNLPPPEWAPSRER